MDTMHCSRSKVILSPKKYISNDRAQDYHNMLSHIFKEMREIRTNGGIHINLDFGNDMKHYVIAIHIIQLVIGYCKRNDLLYGRKGGYSL